MSIQHHPSDETLLRYAAGRLPVAPGLVVATHLSGCVECRARVATFEAMGGSLLEQVTPEPMEPEALARLLAQIDAPAPPPRAPAPRKPLPTLPGGILLPRALRHCEMGRWRWLGPGVRASSLTIAQDPSARLTLLRVGPGRKLPEHGHTGLEFTQILSGSFSDGFGRYRPGDLSEMDSEIDHQPIVDPEGECICLTAMEGEMRIGGMFGRLLTSFARI
ncbi:ChrR family anti-sigma-E factor [Ancylobacter radicis]|uniref:ChrR family anti-sigma-E factor n=1 Tax=Ancylobacter radicis TaxID=2836179 RepID=A0ABS5R6Y6_9HYPH|nr:ChrR family anti-sigma-E factor [Ancylobacter radicis]MBS9477431.1 ChrR family anti-sigma-E factor [Ancylobacter radicis]